MDWRRRADAWDARVRSWRAPALERIGRHPRVLRAWVALEADARTGLDRLVPAERVVATGIWLAALAVLDSVATWVWLRTGTAREGNPLVDQLVAVAGAGPALALRAAWTVGLVALLTWLARRRREARGGLVVVAVALSVVTGLHALGAVLLMTS